MGCEGMADQKDVRSSDVVSGVDPKLNRVKLSWLLCDQEKRCPCAGVCTGNCEKIAELLPVGPGSGWPQIRGTLGNVRRNLLGILPE
jgi:hypothetical protein